MLMPHDLSPLPSNALAQRLPIGLGGLLLTALLVLTGRYGGVLPTLLVLYLIGMIMLLRGIFAIDQG